MTKYLITLLVPLISFSATKINFNEGDGVKCLYIIKGEEEVRMATGKVLKSYKEHIDVRIVNGKEDIDSSEYKFPIKSCTVFEIAKKEENHYEIVKKEVVEEVVQLVNGDEEAITEKEADEIKKANEERKKAREEQDKLLAESMKAKESKKEVTPGKKEESVESIKKEEELASEIEENFAKDMDVDKEPELISRSVFDMIFKGE